MKGRIVAGVGGLALLVAAGSIAAAPFAMVTELKGDAWVLEDAKPQKLALLSYVEKPTEVKVDPAGRLAVTYFADGVQYSFAGPARVSLESPAPKMLEGEKGDVRKVVPEKSIKGGGLSPDQWRRLQQATVVMRSVRPGFTVVGPDKTTVLAPEPEFEWTRVPSAKGYRLVVYAADHSVIHEATTDANAMQPGAQLPLQPGQRYRWKVDALGVQKPQSTSGVFNMAGESMRKEMLELKASIGKDPAARSFFATRLEAQGNTHDARAEWKALARDYPDEPEFRQRAR
jgi:hypothetical protein